MNAHTKIDATLTREHAMEIAQQSTMLSPRFYTTDYDALDAIDVSSVRAEWDALINDMIGDPNKKHFKQDDTFHGVIEGLEPELRAEFVDFLVSSLTSEFFRLRALCRNRQAHQEPGCEAAVQAAGTRRKPPCRLHQRNAQGFGHRYRPRLPDADQEIHLLQAEIHLLRGISVGKDRLRALHHHLPASAGQPAEPLPPDFPLVRRLVATTSSVMARPLPCCCAPIPSFLTGMNKLWVRFFLVSVYATMYVRDHARPVFHKALGGRSDRV